MLLFSIGAVLQQHKSKQDVCVLHTHCMCTVITYVLHVCSLSFQFC